MHKILFFLPNLNGGGAERVTVNIIRQLDQKVFDIKLVLVQKVGKLLPLIPSYVEIIDLNSKKTMFSVLKLRKVIRIEKPDTIYSSLFRMHIALDIALIGIKDKPKTIFRSPNSPKLLLENNEMSFFMKFFLERAYNNADLIIAQTPEMKDEIEKYHKINKDKILILLNPIDKQLIDESIKNIENPFDENNINIVASGRLTKQKGFDILIKSFKDVVLNDKNFKLYIIGEDHGDKQDLETLIDSLKLKDNVYLLGFKSNPYRYFYYANLYVLSSRWEGLPNTVLENLYMKKRIVATKCIPFMDELVHNGKNGILVDVEDIKNLSNAISDYKSIDVNYQTLTFDDKDINSLFLGMMNEK